MIPVPISCISSLACTVLPVAVNHGHFEPMTVLYCIVIVK